MHHSGWLTLIKTTLAAISVYITMSQELPAWLLQAFTKIFKAFLWTSKEVVEGGKCLVAWSKVQRPLQLGGLGVTDLKLMGRALRFCWLWLKRVDRAKPWAALPLQGCGDHGLLSFFDPVCGGLWLFHAVLARPMAGRPLHCRSGTGLVCGRAP
jgi:hypothetical protein